MKKEIIIIGSGGHAKVAIDAVERQGNYKILGLIDSFREVGETTSGYSVLGDIGDLEKIIFDSNVHGLFVAVGLNYARKNIVEQLARLQIELPYVTIIHPLSTVARNASIGEGSLICAGSVIAPDVKIGRHVIINHNASIDHDTVIEEFSSFAPAALCGGNCLIRNSTAICIGAILSNKITIGANSVVGAGSLVLQSQPENSVIYGRPAKQVRQRAPNTPYL